MKAILTVVGKDRTGIIAEVSRLLTDAHVNIEDISQTIMQDYFTMIMMVDISAALHSLPELAKLLKEKGESVGVDIRIQHEDIFNAMHKL